MILKLGKIVCTARVDNDMKNDPLFQMEISNRIIFHQQCLFKETTLCEEDIQTNIDALENGDRVLNSFDTSKGNIWIITEGDRSYTTILYPDEY